MKVKKWTEFLNFFETKNLIQIIIFKFSDVNTKYNFWKVPKAP